jgi:tetratricopeptide (TPR) repeat protein
MAKRRRAQTRVPATTAEHDGADEALFEAQELMYEAFEARGPRCVALALQALVISPNCADAYVLLADETASSNEEARALLEEGVAAGERALGPQPFEEDVGYFWGILETRPYMRARAALAETLWALDRREEAVEHHRELLRLNPNDNQGLRDRQAGWLLCSNGTKNLTSSSAPTTRTIGRRSPIRERWQRSAVRELRPRRSSCSTTLASRTRTSSRFSRAARLSRSDRPTTSVSATQAKLPNTPPVPRRSGQAFLARSPGSNAGESDGQAFDSRPGRE